MRHPLTEREVIEAIDRLIRDAGAADLPTGLAEAFFFPGEWALAFEEIAGLAEDHPGWAAAWSREMAALGRHFAHGGGEPGPDPAEA